MRLFALCHILPAQRTKTAHLYAVFARLGNTEHRLVITCDYVAFLDAPSFDGALYGTIPYAKQNLWAPTRFGRSGVERIC
jgi:hypothetical protein